MQVSEERRHAEDEARFYQQELEAGRTIVTVKSPTGYADALNILRRNGAYDAGTQFSDSMLDHLFVHMAALSLGMTRCNHSVLTIFHDQSGFVILSAAKNLYMASEILRCAQNDRLRDVYKSAMTG